MNIDTVLYFVVIAMVVLCMCIGGGGAVTCVRNGSDAISRFNNVWSSSIKR